MIATTGPRVVRVAAYCRKSHAQGLEQEFNSIDAQREAIEKFVESQRGVGFQLLDTNYSDGGYSGATTDRPAFQRLLADVAARRVDCIAVYRLDRLSRSIRDYLSMLELFEKHGVTFVSVTEQFNTTTPVGRLVLNQLILFSQFEREVISERIRDKMQATRRRGAWTGGRPILGFDAVDKKLVVNPDEAAQVREIFELYLESGTLSKAVATLRDRRWTKKSYSSKSGREIVGRPIEKTTLHSMLCNVLYRGQIRCGDEVVPAAHEAIVGAELWDAVQAQLRDNAQNGGAKTRNKSGALLRGLVRCGRCGSAMIHAFSSSDSRRNRYYLCAKAHAEGVKACPGTRVPAGKFESFITEQIAHMGGDAVLQAKTTASVARLSAEHLERRTAEQRRLEQQRRRAVEQGDDAGARDVEVRLAKLRAAANGAGAPNPAAVRDALTSFQPVWSQLLPTEQERILHLLIEHIIYNPDTGTTDIELRPCGIATLAAEASR